MPTGVYIRTNKIRNKLSEAQKRRNPNTRKHPFKKGSIPWNKKPMIRKECVFCGKEFFVIEARDKTAKFCSISCNTKYYKKGFKKGHKTNLGRNHTQETIEKLKKNHNPKSDNNLTYQLPKGNIPWNKGIGTSTSLQAKIRSLFKYRQWRSDVFTRDNFTCQECGHRGRWIEAHHIRRLREILIGNKIKNIYDADGCEELWDINNGQTLCINCHKKTKR
jgi:hypothetical protein